jgi:bla regulator protein BlaR1
MIAALTDHLWQSTLFVLAATLVAAALRQNGAHIRHRIWLIASMKFVVPLSLLMAVGSALPGTATEATGATPVRAELAATIELIAVPFTSESAFLPAIAATQTGASSLPLIIGAVWVAGFAAVVGMRVRGWRRVRSAVRASRPMPIEAPIPVRSSPGLLEPGIVGFWRPVLLVPEGIQDRLAPNQFAAVLLHELCHARRRDNLTSAFHMVVEAVFWFHPLVWFVGARLVDERERACDEYVLRTAADPAAYAESIVNVCKLYVESPITCVSGVTGSDLKRRVAAIMVNRIGCQLNMVRKAALVLIAILAIALPVAAGMAIAPLRASSIANQSQEAGTGKPGPHFDVVSVKPCEPGAPGQTRSQSGSGGSQITSPGRLYLQCYPLSSMITEAYLYFADGRAHALNAVMDVGVEGGPDWMKTDRYTVEARTGQMAAPAMMRGPMLQAVLEDRFKLKVRRLTRDLPVYDLVPTKSGAKVAPYTGTDCLIRDHAVWPPAQPPEGQRYCGDRSRLDGDLFVREGVMTLDELASFLRFDLPVVNKTGITAPVSYKFAYPKEDATAGGNPPASVVAALRNQLGLELRPSKGPRMFLVIDHAERPTPNLAVEHQGEGRRQP